MGFKWKRIFYSRWLQAEFCIRNHSSWRLRVEMKSFQSQSFTHHSRYYELPRPNWFAPCMREPRRWSKLEKSKNQKQPRSWHQNLVVFFKLMPIKINKCPRLAIFREKTRLFVWFSNRMGPIVYSSLRIDLCPKDWKQIRLKGNEYSGRSVFPYSRKWFLNNNKLEFTTKQRKFLSFWSLRKFFLFRISGTKRRKE